MDCTRKSGELIAESGELESGELGAESWERRAESGELGA
jgi:hypothetical protein